MGGGEGFWRVGVRVGKFGWWEWFWSVEVCLGEGGLSDGGVFE